MMWTASRLSRECAHHHVLSAANPKPSRDKAAAKGTSFHAALQEWHATGVVPAMADPDVAQWLHTMVDNGWEFPAGAELEVAWGLNTWGMFSPVTEPKPHEYEAVDGEPLITAGRADAIWMSDDALVVCDWKSGRTPPPHATINLQLNSAGMALAQRFKVAAYWPCIYFAREGRWQLSDVVYYQDSDDWASMLSQIKAAAALDDQPHPGDWCGSCWERKACPRAQEGRP